LAIAFTLAFAPAQPARAAAPSPVFDLTIEKGREQKQNIDKSKQTYNYAVCTVAAVTPALVWKAFDNSRKIREAEKKRVTSAIDNLETMRDEWMDVQGKASSDEDMFTGLAARQGELDEDAAAQAEVDAKQALEDAEAEAKAAGLDLDELFDTAEEEAEQEAPPARKARRSGAPGAASSGGDKAELSEEASGEGEKLASSDDVERLKRMFGSS